ncbi:MAG: hypothetical protein WC552_03700 [Candidatus Omnitrophota bacterium]
MDFTSNIDDSSSKKLNSFSSDYLFKENTLVVYTILLIMVKMRKELGLEVMLEYMDKYVAITAEHHPKLRYAVGEALSMFSIKKMYQDMMGYGKK